jgi:ribonuclease HI
MRSHTPIFSAEQEAKGKGGTVIATDSFSTIMAVEGTRWTKNPKTSQLMEPFEQEKGRVKLMWIPSHLGITGNERAEEAVKNALKKTSMTENCTHYKTLLTG